jgi:protein TonB
MRVDSPWQRLHLTIPGSLVLTAALLLAFLHLVSLGTSSVAPTPVIDARFVEVGSPGPPSQPAPAPPAPEVTAPAPAKLAPALRPKPKAAQHPTPAAPPTATESVAPPHAEASAASSATAGGSGSGESRRASLGGSMSARALYRPLPEVPEELRHRAVELVAVARFRVAVDGTTQVELITPTAEPSLNQSLVATLRTWRFFPALEEGRPVASTIDLRIPIAVR